MTLEDQLAFTNYLRDYITPSKQEKIEQVLSERTEYVTLVMENIFQSHNASAVIRTAECFSIQEIHAIESKYEFNVINGVAMGSSKWINLEQYKTTGECIDRLKKQGYRIIATTPGDNATLLPDVTLQGKMALLFGTENTGLSEYALEHADEFVKIPMYGFTESFNISVSVAIFLQHIITALRNSSVSWQLTADQKDKIRLEWFSRIVRTAEQHKKIFFERKKK